jgi:NADPH:quinone reductase-like Zn-dependent oxidoreductase
MKSKAFYLTKFGDLDRAFELRDIELPKLNNSQILIEVEAFGLNFADVMARNGLYREAPPLPCILGYEVVGSVIQIGSEQNKDLINKRVLGFCRFGGYAQHVIVENDAFVEIGEISAQHALPLGTQGSTAYYMAEYLFKIRAGEKALVHAAAGGVGNLLIQLLKRKGVFIFAKIGDEAKRNIVLSLGADEVVNYKNEDYTFVIQTKLKEQKLDISFNPAAGSTYKKDLSLIGPGGKLVLFGASELAKGKWGFFSKLNFVKKMGLAPPIGLMMQSKGVFGVNMLRIAETHPEILKESMAAMVDLYKKGEITILDGKQFPYTALNDAHRQLESGKTSGKISVFWDNIKC